MDELNLKQTIFHLTKSANHFNEPANHFNEPANHFYESSLQHKLHKPSFPTAPVKNLTSLHNFLPAHKNSQIHVLFLTTAIIDNLDEINILFGWEFCG